MSEDEKRPQLFDPSKDEIVSGERLAALAHPLRLRMLGLLRVFGPSTATKMAERCDVSSGLTSYHLRQLAESGLIEPVPAPENSHNREKWWGPTLRSTYTTNVHDGPEAQAIGAEYLRSVVEQHKASTSQWLNVQHEWGTRWLEASTISDVSLRLTADELRGLQDEIAELMARYPRHDSVRAAEGDDDPSVVVTVQYQLFPNPEQDPEE
ncbi:helix-turn-helix domain-containing protein [Rhodococcus sp. NPDC080181]|uniref:helix-turn-helix domain-containing protein n=1 Tax=Rhodococcus sp. NPDC080181 TaxID=3155292 RepID=UPI00344ECCFB